MKKISIIGVGKLGVCFALNMENAGYDVIGVDINSDYVDSLNNKSLISNEPKVSTMLKAAKNFRATTNIQEAIEFSDIIFMLVATPSLDSGKYDHRAIKSVIKQLKTIGKQDTKKDLIIGCTVMPGYCNSIKKQLNELNYTVNYNPEFIAQGTIIYDQVYPDMVLIGEETKETGDRISELYIDLCNNKPQICRMDLISSEITKISLNCFITTKIAFANMLGDIAILSGANYESILNAVGSDSRVGSKCLKYGYGFGGPCFPRDNRALFIHSDETGYDAKISKIVDDANKSHLTFQINNYVKTHPDKQTPVTIKGVSYKSNSVMIEESQQLLYAVGLVHEGYNVTVEDNEVVINQVKEKYGSLFKYNII